MPLAHTDRTYEAELKELREKLLSMGGKVEIAISRCVRSVTERDSELAQKVKEGEREINRLEVEIDEACRRLLALRQPAASDLRFITTALKIVTDLERMGDLAVNIAERSIALMREPLVKALIDVPHMANLVESMVRKALDAFVKRDTALARSVLVSDDAVDGLRDAIYGELINFMQKDPTTVRQAIALLFVARDLERIADHATNIAEDVLFVVEGVDVRHHAEARK